jgi:hypothetical protein
VESTKSVKFKPSSAVASSIRSLSSGFMRNASRGFVGWSRVTITMDYCLNLCQATSRRSVKGPLEKLGAVFFSPMNQKA